MEAVYALLGVLLGIAIDEAVRRRSRGEPTKSRAGATAAAQRACGFVAQDYYDR